MARVRKPQPTLESLFFSTPQQKVLRFLLSEPTTTFMPRVISSRLKGVRGLGGTDGIQAILRELEELGFVDFVDNHRAARLRDETPLAMMVKTIVAICDLESLKALLQPVSERGILFGSRASGRSRSDSDYDLFVVSSQVEEVAHIAERHPLAKRLEVVAWTPDDYDVIHKKDPSLFGKLEKGIVIWG